MNLTAALRALLAGDQTLTAMLATYGDPAEPAIFTTDPPPDDAELDYIITAGQVAARNFDTKTETGVDVLRDIRCYAKKTGSAKRVEDIAWRVHQLVHRNRLQVDGRPVLIADASPPRNGPGEDEAYSRIVTVRIATDPA